MKRIIQILRIVSILIITTIPYSVGARAGSNFYVATTGSDNNNGSQNSPFRTIAKCISVAQAGDTCSVQAGTYNERFNVSKAITVACISARTCIIKGATLSSNAIVNGFYSLNSDTNDGGITGSGSGYKILNNKVEGSCMVGVELNGSNGLAEGNEILKSRQCPGNEADADGMRFFGSGHILRGNYIHDIFYDSVNVSPHIDCFQTWSGASNTLIENNICDVFAANSSLANSGANLEDDVATVFRHNYIRSYGKKILFESSSRDGIAEFNIFVGGPIIPGAPTQYGLFADGNNETARNNLFWDIHNTNGTPVLFGIDHASGNLIDVNPQMNGYCSTSHPEIGIPCNVLPPTSTAGAPTATATPTATASPVITNTFTPTGTLIPTSTTVSSITPTPMIITESYVSTSASPLNLTVGNTSLVTASLNSVPVEGYASAEFTCTYNSSLVVVSNITVAGLFGADPVSGVRSPQNGSFIVAIAGSNGNRATVDGTAFTFNIQGLQTGQTNIECMARISRGLGTLTSILSIPANVTISGIGIPAAVPASTTLTGQVFASKLVAITLYNPDSSIAASTTASADGTFRLDAPGGTYTVVATAAGFLSAQSTVTLVHGNTSTKPIVSLPAGDIDGNNIINQLDALTIGMNYNNTIPAAADLNKDGIINVLDLEILAHKYLQSGALAW